MGLPSHDESSPTSNRARGGRLGPWLLASRPKTLPAAVAPVLVGAGLAVQSRCFNPLAVLAALIAALMIQIGTNLANDLGDFRRGADTGARLGPTRVTSSGILSPGQVAMGMWICFGLAALSGLYLVWLGGWPIALLGVLSILAGVAYTAGPLPLGYNGLGDLAVFVFFGLVAVVGTFYVQSLRITAASVLAAVPMGSLITAILVVNNLRDIDTDRAAGKRTLAVILGRAGARAEYVLLVCSAYLVPVLLLLTASARPWVLLPLLSAPVALTLCRRVRSDTGAALNAVLAGTARLAVLFACLFAVGIAL